MLDFLTSAIKWKKTKQKKNRGIRIAKKELSLFGNDMIIYIQNTEDCADKISEIIGISQVSRYMINI